MIQLSALIGHDAIDVSTATSAGKVTGIGLATNRIVSVGIGGDWFDAAAIRGFAGDVVTFESSPGTPGGSKPTQADARGSKVLDAHGDLLGTIADLTITDDGTIDTIQLVGGHSLHGSRLQVIGSHAAIVSAERPPT